MEIGKSEEITIKRKDVIVNIYIMCNNTISQCG